MLAVATHRADAPSAMLCAAVLVTMTEDAGPAVGRDFMVMRVRRHQNAV